MVVRLQAVLYLRQLGDPAASEALRRALRDEDGLVVATAARALGEIGDRDAIDDLIQTLGWSYWNPRQRAAFALGMVPHNRAVPHLAKALRDEHHAVQRAAAWALGHIETPSSLLALRNATPRRPRTRLAVKRALRRLSHVQEA